MVRMAKLKNAYNSFIIVWDVKPTYRQSWARSVPMWSDLTSRAFFKVKLGQPNLKVLITCLLLVLEVWNVNQPICNHVLGVF